MLKNVQVKYATVGCLYTTVKGFNAELPVTTIRTFSLLGLRCIPHVSLAWNLFWGVQGFKPFLKFIYKFNTLIATHTFLTLVYTQTSQDVNYKKSNSGCKFSQNNTCFFSNYASIGNYINLLLSFTNIKLLSFISFLQDERNQILTTNVWIEQVSVTCSTRGDHMGYSWGSHGSHMTFTWITWGSHMDIIYGIITWFDMSVADCVRYFKMYINGAHDHHNCIIEIFCPEAS